MARNEEKALTLFNKWNSFKQDFHSKSSNRRPFLASECDSLVDAEKWRREIVQNLTKKLSAIKNASLGESKIRELNDEINKLIKQKYYWEIRIRELGGNVPIGKQFYDIEGKELPGAPGYKYFGAAKDLPGVRELFQAQDDNQIEHDKFRKSKRSRHEIYQHITPDYYGFRDEEDGVLLMKEREQERILMKEALKQYVMKHKSIPSDDSDEEVEYLRQLAFVADAYNPNKANPATTGVDAQSSNVVKNDEEENKRKEEERLQQEKLAMELKKKNLLSQFNLDF